MHKILGTLTAAVGNLQPVYSTARRRVLSLTKQNAPVVAICAKMEAEMADMSDTEA